MIPAYDWESYRILLTVVNRHGSNTFLLNQVSQGAFMEHWLGMWQQDRDRKIVDMSVTELTRDVFDALEPLYTGNFILE